MSRKREAIFMGLGILAGFVLSGPAAQAADYLTAQPSSQTFYVDGTQAQFEAYQIHGNNSVKLRDIGRAVDFGVTYDDATNSVHIDSTQPYQEDIPATSSGPTEENVRAAIRALRETYPTGIPHALPLQQRRAVWPRRHLLRLGHAVFGCRIWQSPMAKNQPLRLGAAQTRRFGGIQKFRVLPRGGRGG